MKTSCMMVGNWEECAEPNEVLTLIMVKTAGEGDYETILTYTWHGGDGCVYVQLLHTPAWYRHTPRR